MTLILYIAMLAVPLFMIPGMFIATTLAKRVVLYWLATCACLYWLWSDHAAIVFNRVDLPIFVLFAYSAISVMWATNKTVAMRDVVQLGAFVVMYLVAKTASTGVVMLAMAYVGCIAVIIAFGMVRLSKPLNINIAAGRTSVHNYIRCSKTIWPIGNVGGAGFIFMAGTLASVYICIINLWMGIPLILGNLFGLWACSNRASYLGTIVGACSYVFCCR
jgi:hypothetical protein